MQKRSLIILLTILFLFTGKQLFAQNETDPEQQIKYYLEQIQYWRYQYSPEDSGVNPNANPTDSLVAANKMLVSYLQGRPALLRTNFKALDDAQISVATSDDKKLRIFSWDTETGDEKHIYDAVALYETTGGTKAKILNDISAPEHDAGKLYPSVYTVNGNKKYYLATTSSIFSAKDAIKGIYAFAIENNLLTDANVFQTAGGVDHKIEISYDYFSNYDYKGMKEINVVHMDKGKLYIPVVAEDKLNGNWNVYELEGDQFKIKK